MSAPEAGGRVSHGAGIVERLRGGQDNAAYPSRDYMLEAADIITDLLEALELLAAGSIDVSGTALIYDGDPRELVRRAHAAIAKARGEQA